MTLVPSELLHLSAAQRFTCISYLNRWLSEGQASDVPPLNGFGKGTASAVAFRAKKNAGFSP